MKTVVFAYHDMGCLGIEALLAAGYEISAIFTHTDNPGEKAFYGSVARLAAERGIPVYAPDDVNHPLWVERIAQLSPDVIFSFYYRHLICDEILQLAPAGAFNLHGSLLPKYRGRAPLNWVLVNGETETGVTLHRMVKRADAGAIVAQLRVAIAPDDIAITLHHKLCHAARSYWNRHYPPLNTVIFWKSPSAKTKPPVLVAERRMTVSLNGINRHPYCTTWYVPLPIRGRVPSAMLAIRNLPSGRRVFILMPAKHSRGA